MGETEHILLNKLIQGDRLAFEKIFQMYSERIYYFTIKYLRNKEDAEEITQEVFVKLWNRRAAIKTELSFSSYLFMIAKNAVIDCLRKKQKEALLQEGLRLQDYMNHPSAESSIEFKELNQILSDAIDELPEKRREIYLLIREEELSYKEISEKLQISTKTVETHMRLALRQLRTSIKKRYDITLLVGLIIQYFTHFI